MGGRGGGRGIVGSNMIMKKNEKTGDQENLTTPISTLHATLTSPRAEFATETDEEAFAKDVTKPTLTETEQSDLTGDVEAQFMGDVTPVLGGASTERSLSDDRRDAWLPAGARVEDMITPRLVDDVSPQPLAKKFVAASGDFGGGDSAQASTTPSVTGYDESPRYEVLTPGRAVEPNTLSTQFMDFSAIPETELDDLTPMQGEVTPALVQDTEDHRSHVHENIARFRGGRLSIDEERAVPSEDRTEDRTIPTSAVVSGMQTQSSDYGDGEATPALPYTRGSS